jgi:hypothetical protein
MLHGGASNIGAALFTPDNFPGSDNAGLSLVIALFAYCLALLLNLVEALGIPIAILLLAGRLLPGPAVPRQAQHGLHAYMAIAALALLLFVLIMHFLTQRYATLLALLLLAQAPLILDQLYSRAEQSPKLLRRFYSVFIVVTLYLLVDSLFSFGHSSRHVEDGIAWTQEQLPAGAALKTNNFAIAYHSGHVTDYDQTVRDPAQVAAASQPGDYLVLEVDNGDDNGALDTDPALVQLQRFRNERDDEVRVYLRR